MRDARSLDGPNREHEFAKPPGADMRVTSVPMRTPLSLLTLLLIGIAAIRIFYMVLHDPMFGYGNQFDMGRTAACLDLWPELPGGPSDIGYFEAPVESHRIVKIASQECYPGVEAAFDKLAISLDGLRRYLATDSNHVDMRVIGLLKSILLCIAAWLVHGALKTRPWAALMHAAILMIVVADPLNTLYLNTLYGEFFAVLGAYMAIAGIAVLLISHEQPIQMRILLLFSSGVLCLAFSRMQHVLLPVFFIMLFGALTLGSAYARKLPRERLAIWFVVAVLAIATGISIAGNLRFGARNPVFHEVNRSNMLFGALLPASEDLETTVSALGLPPECALLSNSSYFRIAARGLKGACPEALSIAPLSMISVFATQPKLWAVVFGRGLVLSSGWRMRYVGEIAYGKFARVPAGPLGVASSASSLSGKLNFNGHAIFWLLPVWAGLIAAGVLARNQLSKRDMSADGGAALACTVLFCLAVVVMSVWVSALFGDGYSELARHLHLGIIASLASWLILIVLVVRYRPVIPTIFVLLLALGSVMALRGLPLAMGGLSEPEEDRMLATASTFGGWIVAPDHVAAVDMEQQHKLLRRVTVSQSVGLGRLHPLDGSSKTFEFHADRSIFPATFDPLLPVELYAVGVGGGRQRVDIRYPCARIAGCK